MNEAHPATRARCGEYMVKIIENALAVGAGDSGAIAALLVHSQQLASAINTAIQVEYVVSLFVLYVRTYVRA